MPNLFRVDVAEIGMNLGILIGGTLARMVLHMFIIIPILFLIITQKIHISLDRSADLLGSQPGVQGHLLQHCQ